MTNLELHWKDADRCPWCGDTLVECPRCGQRRHQKFFKGIDCIQCAVELGTITQYPTHERK